MLRAPPRIIGLSGESCFSATHSGCLNGLMSIKNTRWSVCCGLHSRCGLYPTENLPGSDSGWQKNKERVTLNTNSVFCFLVFLGRARRSFDFISYTHLHNAGIMELVHPELLLNIISLSPHLYHLPICDEKTTDRGPLGVSWQQLYELTRLEEQRDRETERGTVSERREGLSLQR